MATTTTVSVVDESYIDLVHTPISLDADPRDLDGTLAAASSSPSSSSAIPTPPDSSSAPDQTSVDHFRWESQVKQEVAQVREDAPLRERLLSKQLPTHPQDTSHQCLNELLLAANQFRHNSTPAIFSAIVLSLSSSVDACSSPAHSRKRPRSLLPAPVLRASGEGPSQDTVSGSAAKKRKLSKRHSRRPDLTTKHASDSAVRLSGAFGLRFAKGAGSLRRAQSLRSQPVPVEEDEQILNEVLDTLLSPVKFRPQQDLRINVGSLSPTFDGYAPTVPTTPATNDVPASSSAAAAVDPEPLLQSVPPIAPPPFEDIPRAAFSKEEGAERRILALLAKELEERQSDGLHIPPALESSVEGSQSDVDDMCMEEIDEGDVAKSCSPETSPYPPQAIPRAGILRSSVSLDIDEALLEHILHWILAVMPADEHKTSYSTGDLYDLLSTSPETRFHAVYLFLRYLLLVRSSDMSLDDAEDADSASSEDEEALETVMWDMAVACLALSVKFHRDVLFPLDVIYAEAFLDLAYHEMAFDDLENAQRDVLEAITFRVGSATPGAFMEELWLALPTLRLLVGFDEGWEGVQARAWTVLCDALEDQAVLRYPISLLTCAAVIEGLLEVLAKRYKTTGREARGRPIRKRDGKSLRKHAIKSSRGVRLDIRDVLLIKEVELLECQKWLELTM